MPSKRPATTDDPEYLRRIRARGRCAATGLPGHDCRGVIVAHHSTTHRRGQLRALDRHAFGLAWWCHVVFHAFTGPFAGWTQARRRAFEIKQIAETQRALGWKGAA